MTNIYDNAFEMITNDKSESTILSMKSDLILHIRNITSGKYTQLELAHKLKITQPRVSKLLNGYLGEFSLQQLIKYLLTLDVDVKIELD